MTADRVTNDCVSASVLAEWGWTSAAIRRFLCAPDRTAPNPGYRSAAPMRPFSLARAVTAENTEQWREKAMQRSARGKAVVDAKRAALLAAAAVLDIRVPVVDSDALAVLSVAHWNRVNEQLAESRGCDADSATVDSIDVATLRHWVVNYLRHEGTVYDAALNELYARVGRAEATEAIRDRVYAVIADAYPDLADEACRQAAERRAES